MPGSSPSELPVILQAVPFSTSDALRLGVSPDRLLAADLSRPFHGVRSSVPPSNTVERARAYATRMSDDQFFSHATAAAVWGLPLPTRFTDAPLHVTTPGIQRSARGVGVVGHRTRRTTTTVVVDGLRLTDPIRTFLDLAPRLTCDELVVIGDAILRPPFHHDDRPALAHLPDLARAVEKAGRIPGLRAARDAVSLVRVGSASPGETRLRLSIHRRGLPEPELNEEVWSTRNDYLGRVDFLFRSARVVVEYEGDYHRTDALTFRRDIRRRERFEDDDWRVVRVTGDDLHKTSSQFLDRLERLLTARVPKTATA